ncbi:hypothetical protein KI387_039994, partial [Taxus chinensis]
APGKEAGNTGTNGGVFQVSGVEIGNTSKNGGTFQAPSGNDGTPKAGRVSKEASTMNASFKDALN